LAIQSAASLVESWRILATSAITSPPPQPEKQYQSPLLGVITNPRGLSPRVWGSSRAVGHHVLETLRIHFEHAECIDNDDLGF
jgi:hypothetical protein